MLFYILSILISPGSVISTDCQYTTYDLLSNVQYQLLHYCKYECCNDNPYCCTKPPASSLSRGAVIGIAIGCVVAVGIILVIVVCLCCVRRTKAHTGGVIYQTNASGVAIVGKQNSGEINNMQSTNVSRNRDYPYFASQSLTAYNRSGYYTGSEQDHTPTVRHRESDEHFYDRLEPANEDSGSRGRENNAYSPYPESSRKNNECPTSVTRDDSHIV